MRKDLGEERSFAVLLRRFRERAGVSQQELAERAGLSPDAVGALERGTRTRPYPSTVRSLADALGVTPEERSALVASVPRRNEEPGAANATPASAATGLVVPPTRLYGRQDDLARVEDMFAQGARLVTLVGPGGAGKTRLAAALSEALRDTFPAGVVQVALAPLTDPVDVMPTLARALGVSNADGRDLFVDVADHLEDRRMLVVLDNLEHLLGAADDLGRLVALCPEVRLLVTSRSALRLRIEQVHVVRPLALPAHDASDTAALTAAPAGALLLDRARAATPDLGTSPTEVRTLAELCHRLAGLPLAIELATARLGAMPPQMLLDRLEEAMDAPGARDLPDRQRTMRSTLDWSFGLLDEEQQRLFTLLGTFRGGADLEAVEAVASSGDGIPVGSVLGLLEELVTQSLVVMRPARGRRPRFAMLEPVAQYARSMLVGERAAAIARAHAAYFLALAERAADGYEREDQVRWLERIDDDHANLLTAVERSLELRAPDIAGRIVWSMWLYWWLRHRLAVGRRMAEQCLAQRLSPGVRARVHLTAATMTYAGGEPLEAGRHWEAADRIGVELDDPELIAKARGGTGLVALAAGDLASARERFEATLSVGAVAGDRGVWIRSLTHVWLGTTLLLQGDPLSAVHEAGRGLELARARGDRLSTYIGLYTLSQAALASAEDNTARGHVREGILLSVETGDLTNLTYFLEALGVIESRAEQHARVARLFGAATALRETDGGSVYGYYLPDETLRTSAEQAAREELGEDRYDREAQLGQTMDVSDVVRFALGSSADGLRGSPARG